ncbi:hypothetical protein GH879_32420, partial [Bacillus thuringiensis]|nr:hypothetical protein [Bacillus thuringiensis]
AIAVTFVMLFFTDLGLSNTFLREGAPSLLSATFPPCGRQRVYNGRVIYYYFTSLHNKDYESHFVRFTPIPFNPGNIFIV